MQGPSECTLPTPAPPPTTLSPGRLNISICLIAGVSEGFKCETEAKANGDFTKNTISGSFAFLYLGPQRERDTGFYKHGLRCAVGSYKVILSWENVIYKPNRYSIFSHAAWPSSPAFYCLLSSCYSTFQKGLTL